MIPEYLSSLGNHLWQSTLFAGAVGLLALPLKKNRAAVRFRLWLAASLKFLLPFSLLISIGRQVEWPADRVDAPTALVSAVEGFSQPFAFEPSAAPSTQATPIESPRVMTSRIPLLLFLVWVSGAGLVCFIWLRAWRRMRISLNAASAVELNIPVRVRMTSAPIEPGIVGILRPVLLLPKGLMDRLTPAQVDAILTHELCHVRRRDNLAAAIHMVVETAFWFHPLVWWIENRLVEERERACDEEVLHVGGEPQAYAEGILNVCRFYKESSLVCVSGVTGANLKKRIEEIMRNRVANKLDFSRTVLLAVAAITALAGPIAIGVVHARTGQVQSEPAVRFESAVRPAVNPIVIGEQRPATARVAEVKAPRQEPRTVAQNLTEARETFEVVSIRPANPAAPGPGARGGGPGLRGGGPAGPTPCGGMVQLNPGRLVITNATLYRLIVLAYGKNCRASTEIDLITGAPEWSRSVAFDVQAVIPAGSPSYTQQQLGNGEAPKLQMMLQHLLADRFNLALHRDTKEAPAYNLVVVRPGKITLSEDQTPPPPLNPLSTPPPPPPPPPAGPAFERVATMSRGGFALFVDPPAGKVTLSARAIPLSQLINVFQGQEGRLVIDKSGMKGLYDIPQQTLDVGTFEIGPGAVSVWPEIMQQLGFKLEPTRAPAEVLVIDRAEKPSEN